MFVLRMCLKHWGTNAHDIEVLVFAILYDISAFYAFGISLQCDKSPVYVLCILRDILIAKDFVRLRNLKLN